MWKCNGMALMVLVLIGGVMFGGDSYGQGIGSGYRVVDREGLVEGEGGELEVRAVGVGVEGGRDAEGLPIRVIVTGADGGHVDGSGRGLYEDGRFFAEGSFVVGMPAGRAEVVLRSGPNYVPLEFGVEVEAGKRTVVEARLAEWFRPESLGWYSGDNHVHTQHDARAAVRTDLEYMALQARANGLNWVTEAGSDTSYEMIDKLDREGFLLRYAPELRPGAFIGHINTPGIDPPLAWGEWQAAQKRVLPVYHLLDEVHKRGGIVIHTHPLTPVTQLHWMGATEVLSDAVLGRTADLLDQDYPATRQLYYALLNLGNKIGVSGYTDAALGRERTLSPGDRRVYAKAAGLEYGAIVEAMRLHRTVATSGGPLFVELDVEGAGPGEEVGIERGDGGGVSVRVETTIHSLNAIREAMLIVNGEVVHRFDVRGQKGHVELDAEVTLSGERLGLGMADWALVYVEAEPSHWAITSPVWIGGGEGGAVGGEAGNGARKSGVGSDLVVLQISNAERLSKLTHDFFAHVIATVSPGRSIESVELLRDGEVVRGFEPGEGDVLHGGRVPVSEMPGPYGPGWAWERVGGGEASGVEAGERAVHLQADWPVEETGWYTVRLRFVGGEGERETVESDGVYFDSGYPFSRQMSVVNLRGAGGVRFMLQGYGEEMPLVEIPEPWEGDRWWYPRQTWWRMRTVPSGHEVELRGGSFMRAAEWFGDARENR